MKKITMQDIADKLNISKNSVSQALSNKPGVSENTRDLIIKTADELGYIYKNQTSSISKPKYLGLIASDFAFSKKSFFGEIFLSLEKECKEQGYALLTQSISDFDKENLNFPYFIEQNMIEGLFIVSHISNNYIQKILETNIPAILVDHHNPRFLCDAVLTNNRLGSYQAVKHLIEKGHTRIGFMGDVQFSPSYYERLDGYLLASKEFSLEPDYSIILDSIEEKQDVIFEKLSSLEHHPTAWICVNDGLGYFALSYYQENNFKIPYDIAICNFDNGYLSRVSKPNITTIDINLKYYGKKAFSQLLTRIENPDEPFIEILLPTSLIERESS
ncbi:LacI family DNA-binding transcriptional regulator [Clostridium sp.]|uniref:LacI family DNA-binding transcriptional regulator n=1 Tax=Clostridium sp. TaxID=1506 RepID=UPI003463FBB0